VAIERQLARLTGSAVDSLARCRLYAILDLGYVAPNAAEETVAQLIRGGADIIQLRGKKQTAAELSGLAEKLHGLTSHAGIPLIINDHPKIVREVAAEGLHLGQDDCAIATAREIVGRECWVGKSTHSLAQAVAAEAEGADYIGFGPLFATPTKPDYQPIGTEDIRRAHELLELPIFCIGGVKLSNLSTVLAAGAKRVVIVSGLLQSSDIAATTRAARDLLGESET
jgi:thiamine-phosphate pyrophosphorylase